MKEKAYYRVSKVGTSFKIMKILYDVLEEWE